MTPKPTNLIRNENTQSTETTCTKAEDVETSPSSSSHHSLKRNATEAEMDKPDDEMEITHVEKLMAGGHEVESEFEI